MGLCSGADAAFRVAVEDKRVTGAALIDFHYQPTTGYYLECYGKLMLNYRSWLRLFRGKSDVWGPLTSVFGRLRRAKKLDEVHSGADTDKILENFGLLGERGVKLLMVFSGRSAADYHYRRTFARRGGAVHEQVVVIDDTDHVFTRLSKQRALVAGVDDWVRSTLKQQRAAPECATIRP